MTKPRVLNRWRIRQFVLIAVSVLAVVIVLIHIQSDTSFYDSTHHKALGKAKDGLRMDILLARDKIAGIKMTENIRQNIKDKSPVSPRKVDAIAYSVRTSLNTNTPKAKASGTHKKHEIKSLNRKAERAHKSNRMVSQPVLLHHNTSRQFLKNSLKTDAVKSESHNEKEHNNFDKNTVHERKLSLAKQKDLGKVRVSRIGDNDMDPWLKGPYVNIPAVYSNTSLKYNYKRNPLKKNSSRNKLPDIRKDKNMNHLAVQGIGPSHKKSSQTRVPLNLTKEIFIFEVMRESKKDRHSVKDSKCVLLHSHFVESPICIHDPNEDEIISAALAKEQTWEPNLLYVTGRILTNNLDLKFLDLGCNLGMYTIVAAKLGINVIAVDPNKQNLRLLTKSLSLGGIRSKVTMLWNAVSNIHEKVTLNDIVGNVGGSFVETAPGAQSNQTGFVRAILMDDLIPFFKGTSVFVKMDIETYEWKALQGAEKFFKELDVAYILMEWSYHKEHGDGPEIVEFMYKRGLYPHINANYNTQLEKENYESWPDNVLWIKYSNILVE